MNKHARKMKSLANRLDQIRNELLDLREETPGWRYQMTQTSEAIITARFNLIELSRRAEKHASWEDEQMADMAAERIPAG